MADKVFVQFKLDRQVHTRLKTLAKATGSRTLGEFLEGLVTAFLRSQGITDEEEVCADGNDSRT